MKNTYEDLILSLDGDAKTGRVAFRITRGCKIKDSPDGETHITWTRMMSKLPIQVSTNITQVEENVYRQQVQGL